MLTNRGQRIEGIIGDDIFRNEIEEKDMDIQICDKQFYNTNLNLNTRLEWLYDRLASEHDKLLTILDRQIEDAEIAAQITGGQQ